jgi:hypothetical protein
MRKLIYILPLVFMSSLPSLAQKFIAGFEGYIGINDMTSLKESQQLPENYPIPYKSVQNFPAQPGIRIYGLLNLNERLGVGLNAGHTKTGSRLTYSDYTGSTYRDVVVSAFYVGSYNRFTLFTQGPWSFDWRLSAGVILNTATFENRITLVDPAFESKEQSKWTSTNFFSDMGAEGRYRWKQFNMKAFASFEINSGEKPKIKSGSEEYPGTEFKIDWTGIRLGLGVEYRFEKRQE